ncbi:MAG: hypothetical protein LBF22_03465, partial [Deltaproteobacteria bacterium]|nr:hypothetical protein [Deltaproteobacteria bacterium]
YDSSLKKILALQLEGHAYRKIADILHISKSSVGNVIKNAKNLNMTYESIKDLPDNELRRQLFPVSPIKKRYLEPDFNTLIKNSGNLSLKKLYLVYKDSCQINKKKPLSLASFYRRSKIFKESN